MGQNCRANDLDICSGLNFGLVGRDHPRLLAGKWDMIWGHKTSLLPSGFIFGPIGREPTIEMTWAVPLPAVEIIPDSQFSKGIASMPQAIGPQ